MSGLEGCWLRDGGGGGSYQLGVYMPLKALFLVIESCEKCDQHQTKPPC